jgi:phosphopantothenoylcysteine decarboxylase / phosphopantothenate---cysteine ligase
MTLQGKKILLGVTGSIAAYKAALLIRQLVKAGAEVQPVMTAAASGFVAPLTLSTLSKRECLVEYITGNTWNNHVHHALWADAMLIAPASANTIAKMANGICDNLLLAIYLSVRCPVFIAPAMDEDMWKHGSTRSNLNKLEHYGNTIIPVDEGELASGLTGPGRMAEPEAIVSFLEKYFSTNSICSLSGKKMVITAGPTYEYLDPVRFIGNASSGKMGIALAEEAARNGATVTLILGPSSLKPENPAIQVLPVTSAADMLKTFQQASGKADICIFAAAVADYTPAEKAPQKIKKKEDQMDVPLKKTADIAAWFGENKLPGQLSVGFALETEHEMEHAREKKARKNFDLVVMNSLNDKGAGFQHDTNKVTILDRQNKMHTFELKSKPAVAADIIAIIAEQIA